MLRGRGILKGCPGPLGPKNEQEKRKVCPWKWVGRPLPYARPEMQKSGRKRKAYGEDEAGNRGEVVQQPIRMKEKLRRQGVVTAKAREQKDPQQ